MKKAIFNHYNHSSSVKLGPRIIICGEKYARSLISVLLSLALEVLYRLGECRLTMNSQSLPPVVPRTRSQSGKSLNEAVFIKPYPILARVSGIYKFKERYSIGCGIVLRFKITTMRKYKKLPSCYEV